MVTDTETKNKISIIKRGQILLKIQKGESLEPIFTDLSAYQMKELRNFLEEEVIYLSSLKDDKAIKLSEIKSNYEPVPNYYYRQDCREPLEACLNETCLTSNPECFSRKMRGQIDEILKVMKPYLEHN